jgi:hypothetical protein
MMTEKGMTTEERMMTEEGMMLARMMTVGRASPAPFFRVIAPRFRRHRPRKRATPCRVFDVHLSLMAR